MDDDTSVEEEENRQTLECPSYRLLEAGFVQFFEQMRREGKSLWQLLEERRLGGREETEARRLEQDASGRRRSRRGAPPRSPVRPGHQRRALTHRRGGRWKVARHCSPPPA